MDGCGSKARMVMCIVLDEIVLGGEKGGCDGVGGWGKGRGGVGGFRGSAFWGFLAGLWMESSVIFLLYLPSCVLIETADSFCCVFL